MLHYLSKMKLYTIIAGILAFMLGVITVTAELSVRDRIRYFPLLVPTDHNNFVHDKLPEVLLLTEKETERAYGQLKELQVNTTNYSWQQLAVCFMLQGKYDEALNCFIKAEEAITRFYDNSVFKAWLLEHGGDTRRASREWARLLEQDNTTYGYAVRLASCQLKMRQALGVSKTMEILERRAPNNPVTPHLQGVRYFMIGDFQRATERFVYSAQLAEKETLPETYLAMSMLTLQEGKREEVIGWLKRALEHATPRNRIIYYNLPPFAIFHEDQQFNKLAETFNIPLEKEGLEDATLDPHPADGMHFYVAKFDVPENLRVHLQLQFLPPETKVRTLGFNFTQKKDSETAEAASKELAGSEAESE